MGYSIVGPIEPIPDIAFRREQDLGSGNGYRGMTPNFLDQRRYGNGNERQQTPSENRGVVDYEGSDLGVHGRNLPSPVRPFLYDRNGVVSGPVTGNVGRGIDAYD